MGVMPFFGQKLLNTQCGVGRYSRKSPIMKWSNPLKESSRKNSLKLSTASRNDTSWYAGPDGFLGHSPSGKSCTTRGLPSGR